MEKVIQVINDLVMKEAELDKLLLEDILRRHGLYERWEKYGGG